MKLNAEKINIVTKMEKSRYQCCDLTSFNSKTKFAKTKTMNLFALLTSKQKYTIKASA